MTVRHVVMTKNRIVYVHVFALLVSVLFLACNNRTQPTEREQALGAGTVTAWANQGTVFPELATTSTTTIASPAAVETSTTALSSPIPLPTSTLSPSSATQAAGTTAASGTPLPTVRPITPRATPEGSQEVVGRVTVPTLGIDASIIEVSWHLDEVEGQSVAVWDTPPEVAGHHRGTAAPGGVGNCVISGHSRSEDGGVFSGLWDIQPGDIIQVSNAQGEPFDYVVDRVEKVQEMGQPLAQRLTNASFMDPSHDARLTLITCWPDWAYTHRIIVVAQLQ